MYRETIHVRVSRKLREDVEEVARSLGETPSEFIRRAIEERVGKVRGNLTSSQLSREDKIKEIFRMLNAGKSRWEIAEQIGDPNLIDECYEKWARWKRESQIEDAEKRKLCLEAEYWKLGFFALKWKSLSSNKLASYAATICTFSKRTGIPPSELLRCPVDRFINEAEKMIEEERKLARENILNYLSQYLSRDIRMLERRAWGENPSSPSNLRGLEELIKRSEELSEELIKRSTERIESLLKESELRIRLILDGRLKDYLEVSR